jgi:hypothetical protein
MLTLGMVIHIIGGFYIENHLHLCGHRVPAAWDFIICMLPAVLHMQRDKLKKQ